MRISYQEFEATMEGSGVELLAEFGVRGEQKEEVSSGGKTIPSCSTPEAANPVLIAEFKVSACTELFHLSRDQFPSCAVGTALFACLRRNITRKIMSRIIRFWGT